MINADNDNAQTQNSDSTTAASPTKHRARRRAARKAASNRSNRSVTKLDAARKIFDKVAGSKPRKDVIEQMCAKADLTAATASAYYQRLAHDTHLKRGAIPRATYTRKGGGDTKASVARTIFKRMSRKPRKDVIEQLMKQAKLTSAGASTYYQKLKQEAA